MDDDEKPASREVGRGVIGASWAEPGHPERLRLAGITGAKVRDLNGAGDSQRSSPFGADPRIELGAGRPARQSIGHMVVVASPSRTASASGEVFFTNSFADHVTEGDITGGEDPVVRQAAVAALGHMNGTVLAIEPSSGRILAMVNQKLALSGGAQPCSTIKLSVALAALSEGIITKETKVKIGSSYQMNLTTALARSNNQYFETLGRELGFEKVQFHAHQYGLGELAGVNISGEQPGIYPAEEVSPKLGGIGRMCSFGEGISMTPLQLGALVSAIANGGTLYYLQHPISPEQAVSFQPVIKRQLDIAPLIGQISDGWQEP